MKHLKRLVAAIALTFIFALSALADCQPPVPGIMDTPPCLGTQITPDDPVASAEPRESSTSIAPNVIEISVTTIDMLLSALSIF